jgi:hypothetical protein
MAKAKAPRAVRIGKLLLGPRGRRHLKAAKDKKRYFSDLETGIRSQMGNGITPNRKLMEGMPQSMADLKKAMKVVDDLHENLSRGYTVLEYGERVINLNEWFLKNRVGLTDRSMRRLNNYAPRDVRHKELEPLEEREKLMEIDMLRGDLMGDEHVHPEERDSIIENLDFMKRKFKVKDRWPGIKTLAENNERMMELLTRPKVGHTPEGLRPIIKSLNAARTRYTDAIPKIPKKGRFEAEHAARVYPILHDLVERGIVGFK